MHAFTLNGSTVNAYRPDVAALAREFRSTVWGAVAIFAGRAEQLVAAGLAVPREFAEFGRSRQRTRYDEYGNKRVTYRRGPEWELEMHLGRDGARIACPVDAYGSARRSEAAAQIEADVAALLARILRRSSAGRTS